jgi:hypothetical protein
MYISNKLVISPTDSHTTTAKSYLAVTYTQTCLMPSGCCYCGYLSPPMASAMEPATARFLYYGFAGANLTLDGTAMVTSGGHLELTNGTATRSSTTPLRSRDSFKNATAAAVRSFSASFVFGMAGTASRSWSHGARTSRRGWPARTWACSTAPATAARATASGARHDPEPQVPRRVDGGKNHTGVDVNSLASVAAGYYNDRADGEFWSLTPRQRREALAGVGGTRRRRRAGTRMPHAWMIWLSWR